MTFPGTATVNDCKLADGPKAPYILPFFSRYTRGWLNVLYANAGFLLYDRGWYWTGLGEETWLRRFCGMLSRYRAPATKPGIVSGKCFTLRAKTKLLLNASLLLWTLNPAALSFHLPLFPGNSDHFIHHAHASCGGYSNNKSRKYAICLQCNKYIYICCSFVVQRSEILIQDGALVSGICIFPGARSSADMISR